MNKKVDHNSHSKEFRVHDEDTSPDDEFIKGDSGFLKTSMKDFIRTRVMWSLLITMIALFLFAVVDIRVNDTKGFRSGLKSLYAWDLSGFGAILNSIESNNDFVDFFLVLRGYHAQHKDDKKLYRYIGFGVSMRKHAVKVGEILTRKTGCFGEKQGIECGQVAKTVSFEEMQEQCKAEGARLPKYHHYEKVFNYHYLPNASLFHQFFFAGINKNEHFIEVTETRYAEDEDKVLLFVKNHSQLKMLKMIDEDAFKEEALDEDLVKSKYVAFRCVKYVKLKAQ